MAIEDVQFVAASHEEARSGLIGWISLTLAGRIRLDGLTLRRTHDDRAALSFPARRDAHGKQHFFVHPVDEDTRREIENQVFAAIGLGKLVSR